MKNFNTMKIEDIRNELAEKIKSIEPLGKKLKFKLDEDIILIDGTSGENLINAIDEEADCTIIMSKETYVKLQKNEIKPMMATLTGKIKVKGDLNLARKLKQLT